MTESTAETPFTLTEHSLNLPYIVFVGTRRAASFLKRRGNTVSRGSYWDTERRSGCVFSAECGGARTLNHPDESVGLRLNEAGDELKADWRGEPLFTIRLPRRPTMDNQGRIDWHVDNH
jgi:hypothetical protein